MIFYHYFRYFEKPEKQLLKQAGVWNFSIKYKAKRPKKRAMTDTKAFSFGLEMTQFVKMSVQPCGDYNKSLFELMLLNLCHGEYDENLDSAEDQCSDDHGKERHKSNHCCASNPSKQANS